MITSPRSSNVDARIAAAAMPGFPVVTRRALRAVGVSSESIAARLRDGRLTTLWTDTFLMVRAPSPFPRDLLAAAAVATGGTDASLDGMSSLFRHGFWNRNVHHVHVAASGWHADVADFSIRFHRRRELDHSILDGIPTRVPLLALLAVAVDLTPHQAAFVVGKAEHAKEFSRTDVAELCGDRPRHSGVTTLRQAVDLRASGSAGTKSASEDVLLPHVEVRYGAPLVNVMGATGIVDYEPDFCWFDQRWIVEVDGDQHHDDLVQRRRDEERDTLLRATGWRLVRVPWREVWGRRLMTTLRRIEASFFE